LEVVKYLVGQGADIHSVKDKVRNWNVQQRESDVFRFIMDLVQAKVDDEQGECMKTGIV
jgi:hypothetical protein